MRGGVRGVASACLKWYATRCTICCRAFSACRAHASSRLRITWLGLGLGLGLGVGLGLGSGSVVRARIRARARVRVGFRVSAASAACCARLLRPRQASSCSRAWLGLG